LLCQRLFGYTLGMKTAVSIPDPVYSHAERLARQLGKSRSQLYSEALAEYVARHDPEPLTEVMNQVCAEVETESDPAWSVAARRVFERSEW
jgi:metal-responsive CopG/Arc/MetJ family transcriptional regulator